ncbi:sensor histidine kinase KdpD [Caulobacter sp. BP25]|uniref:sensor histidine kinase n=1 Tax=Caulobacter sp. BP25 TaxID=2048900 RepID=UPI000C12A14A|nr:HAMP domain-containing sensor histidine kinase [Caulobacter sp. BP25]PHY18852.1 histidine kinase [Caulobacter sp. BP25]
MIPAVARRRLGPPLWVRILAVVVGALVAAQLVTLALTVFFPPAPPSQYSLSDIEAALRGRETRHDRERPLVRTLEAAPPSLDSPGWVVSPTATRDLAKLVGAPESDVRLLFYAPPPLAGAPIAPPPLREARSEASQGYVLAGMVPPGGGMARPRFPGGAPVGAFPGGRFPAGAFANRASPVAPASGFRGAAASASGRPFARGADLGEAMRRSANWPGASAPSMADGPSYGLPGRPIPGAGALRQRLPALSGRPSPSDMASLPAFGARPDLAARPPRGPIIRTPLDAAVFGVRFSTQILPVAETPRVTQSPPEPTASVELARTEPLKALPADVEPIAPPKTERILPTPSLALSPTPAAPKVEDVSTGRTLSAPVSRFGFATPSYVEGEFVAALKQSDGRWATVRPQPEGFPNSWQRRIMLWFGLSVALITPLALLLAKRLAAPLKAFADSAERLGREPSADLAPLTGPAEIGVAAEAFNQMQRRIKRYVDDRTGMVRAISHDLRTPLARMRFKLERAPPSLRAAIGRDMDQMEQMIASVLSFMRDEMEGHERQVVDLRSLLEVVVDDATGPVTLEPGPAVLVEIDVVAIQRVMENLIDNAVKYGFEARLKLETFAGEACVTVRDSGPGIPPEELEDVFKAYHRGTQALASGKAGVGLGLVVSRSTVRAHGGELTLRPGSPGLIAEIRLPGARTVEAAA